MIIFLLFLNTFAVVSQTATLVPVISEDEAIMFKVSDNGLWTAGYYEAEVQYYGASIWSLTTYERKNSFLMDKLPVLST